MRGMIARNRKSSHLLAFVIMCGLASVSMQVSVGCLPSSPSGYNGRPDPWHCFSQFSREKYCCSITG